MNEEKLLRDYLFHFLRSPNYKTDVNFYLPKFLINDPNFSETQRVLSDEHERYRLKVIDFAKQFQPQTATWGLNIWEEELGLPTDLNLSLDLRRAKIMAKLLGTAPMTVANTNKLINLFTDDGKGYVDELPEDGTIKVIVPSKNAYIDEMHESLDEMLPAHLVYDIRRIIEIDNDEEDGKPDSLVDINDEDSTADINGSAFFMHAEFPILENIPYGSWYDAPKYNGEVIARMANSLDGSIKYNGKKIYNGIDSETKKAGKPFTWWFVSTGNSSFNKEFQCNGAIRYDGFKPQTIEYDNGMDEFDKFEITKVIDEKVVSADKFDGTSIFNGSIIANKSELSTDTGGDLEIKRFRLFDGAVNYDGGDLNYFNGAIRADGKFNFTGDGIKAEIEILTDNLNGKLSNVRPKKENSLPYAYQETFDFVPGITEKQSISVLNTVINETVTDVSDDYNALKISRAFRYDGAKDYSGGNLNYFNGTMKADGKFKFESGGNQAKVEIIAVDLDGTFSLSNPISKKVKLPFIHIENTDFVSKIQDETSYNVQANFEDVIDLNDNKGNLTIRKRAKFDGSLLYTGYFEYAANATKRFDGGLNYNSIFRAEACNDIRFNGNERYGGRMNHTFIEYVTDLDGNVPFVDFNNLEKIPVATHSKIGFVMIGNNIDVNNEGEISVSDMFTSQSMSEIQTGILPALFKNRRG